MLYDCTDNLPAVSCAPEALAFEYPTPIPYQPAHPEVHATGGFAGFELQALLALLLYLFFFGWIGVLRGTFRELVVFLVALITWLVLQIRGEIVITLTNLAGKLVQSILSGEFGDADLAAIAEKPDIVTEQNSATFLFFVWAVVVLITYIVTQRIRPRAGFGNPGWAFLLGIANGLLFAAILLPRLLALILPGPVVPSAYPLPKATGLSIFDVLNRAFRILVDGIRSFWQFVQPQEAVVLLLLITLFLLIAAITLRRGQQSGGGGAGTSTT
jgi:hypothetical protein